MINTDTLSYHIMRVYFFSFFIYEVNVYTCIHTCCLLYHTNNIPSIYTSAIYIHTLSYHARIFFSLFLYQNCNKTIEFGHVDPTCNMK